MMLDRTRALAVLLLALSGGCGIAGAGWWLAGPALLRVVGAHAVAHPSLSTLLCAGFAVALLGCVGWLLVVATLTLTVYAARVLAPRHAGVEAVAHAVERGCPRWLREVVAASVGLAVSVSVAGTAPALAHPHPGPVGGPERLDGLRLPDRTTGAPLSVLPRRTVAVQAPGRSGAASSRIVSSGPATPATRATGPRTVLVRRGDSLWRIAAAHLPSRADDAEVTDAWHRLRDANAARIGPDPDLIHPGVQLRLPDLSPAHRKDAP